MNDIIRFEQVTKAYGDQVILKAFDLKIRKGEFLTVIGSSGSGKTTMLKLINGLSAPTQGKYISTGKTYRKRTKLFYAAISAMSSRESDCFLT